MMSDLTIVEYIMIPVSVLVCGIVVYPFYLIESARDKDNKLRR